MPIISVADNLKLALRDKGDSEGGFLKPEEYERFVLKHASKQQSYPLTLIMEGRWVYQARLALYSPSLVEEPGCTYLIDAGGTECGGPTVSLTAGTDSRDPLTLTGCPVNWSALMVELLMFIANYRAMAYSQTVSGGAVSPQTARAELIRMAQYYRGLKAY